MDENGPNVRNVQSVSVSEFSRDFLAGIPAGAYQVDEQGNFLYCNNEAAKILGYDSSEELLRKNIYDLYFDREYRYKILDRMRKAGGRLESYIHWKRKNGSEIVVNDYAEFVYDDNGKEIGVRGIFVEATYEQLFDDLNAGIFRIGPDMKTFLFIDASTSLSQYFTLRYRSTHRATNSSKSGSKANGPNPYSTNPEALIIIGFDTRSFMRKTKEKINSPIVN